MAKLGFRGLNEGSLLRRTLLYVSTFVLGSAAFVGLLSFLLVSISKGLLPAQSKAKVTETEIDSADSSNTAVPGKPNYRKRGTVLLPGVGVEGRSAKKDEANRDDG